MIDQKKFNDIYAFSAEALSRFISDPTMHMLSSAMSDGTRVAQVGHALGRPRREVHFGLLAAADASTCLFAQALKVKEGLHVCGRPVRFQVREQEPSGPAPGTIEMDGQLVPFEVRTVHDDNSLINAGRWLNAFWLNLLCRKGEALAFVCHVPPAQLRASSTISPDYAHEMVRMCQALIAGDPKTADLLLRALEGTEPNRPDVFNPERTLFIDVQILNVLARALADDSVEFQRALTEALELHQEYWTADEDRRGSWQGFLPLELLAIAGYAYDRGLRFRVESPYLPMWLVRGQFSES